MFLKLNTLRRSANTVTSARPSLKPLLMRMSRFLFHGIVELLIGSSELASRPKPTRGAVDPAPELPTRVKGSPLNARNVANTLTSRNTFPTVVFFSQSVGTVNETEPTMLCCRWSSTGSGCSGGGTRSPVTCEICREEVFRYENGSEPVLRAIWKV